MMERKSRSRMELVKIGIIHSPYRTREEAPRQGMFRNEASTIEVRKEYGPGLKGIEKYRHLLVFYWADQAARDELKSRRREATGEERGVFASRSPARPNPICLCVCEVTEIDGNLIKVKGLDAVDGSPLLDLKPFVTKLDCPTR